MSEPENFIARWSRRKREAAEDAEATKSSPAPDAAAESAHPIEDQREGSDASRARSGASEPPEFAPDPAKLPPIEAITAETDIRAFLAPGVPPELTRAALRRAWAADPAEGEAWTETGSDLVDVVPMPEAVRAAIDAFVAEHHVERPFYKRERDRADPEALARRGPMPKERE